MSVSTDAQWVVRVTPLVETGCTSPGVTAETVEKTPLTSASEVETRDESRRVVNDVGVYTGGLTSQDSLHNSSAEDLVSVDHTEKKEISANQRNYSVSGQDFTRPDAGYGNDVITHATVMTSNDDVMRSVIVESAC